MKTRLKKILLSAGLFTSSFNLMAGVSPYLPLKQNPVFELEVERLVAITKAPTLKKPYHVVTILNQLEKVKDTHPQLYERINRYIKRYKNNYNITHAKAEVRVSNSTDKTLQNARGYSTDSNVYADFSAFWQPSQHFGVSVGGGYANKESYLNFGNYFYFGGEYLQIDVGYREHWLSPLQESSQLISTQAKPMLGMTLSNVKPITDFNIMYELGFGKLEEVDGIVFEDTTSTGQPGFLTMHGSIQPFDWWTLSVNRTMQFSGGDRGNVNFKDIWQAIIDPVSSDNCGGQSSLVDCNQEFGNQQASIVNQFNVSLWDKHYQISFEVAGEDTNDYSNYKLGNKAYSLSVFIPYLSETESLNITAQLIEDAWYTHHLYRHGYSNDGHKMGHWWGDEKGANDNIGANIFGIAYTKDLTKGSRIGVKYNTIENKYSESTAANNYERGHYVQVDYNWTYQSMLLGIQLYTGKDVDGEFFSSLAFSTTW